MIIEVFMTTIDYMKIIDIISDIFSANHQVELKTTDGKIQTFEVETKMSDGSLLRYKMDLQKYDVSVYINKNYFIAKDIKKIISSMEYNLEQEFGKNVKMNLTDDGEIYTITIGV